MTDEEKAEEYADKILSDSKYPFIFSKEKVKAYIIKVYLDSLKCCENAYNKGFAEGRKEGYEQGKNNERELQCGKKNYEKDLAKLEKENARLSKMLEMATHDNSRLHLISKGWFNIDKGYDEELAKAKECYRAELEKRVEKEE